MKIKLVRNFDYFIAQTKQSRWASDVYVHLTIPSSTWGRVKLGQLTRAFTNGKPPNELSLVWDESTFTPLGVVGIQNLLNLNDLPKKIALSLRAMPEAETLGELIAVLAASKKNLNFLNLENNELDNFHLRLLLTNLPSNFHLNIASNSFTEGHSEILSSAILTDQEKIIIEYSGNGLTAQEMRPLAIALTSGSAAKYLTINLSDNEIGDEGMEILAEEIAKGALPEYLTLEFANNGITDIGLNALIQALQRAKRLPNYLTINIGYNHITEVGAQALLECLQSLYPPVRLRLKIHNNEVSDNTYEQIKNINKKNDVLSVFLPLMVIHSQKYNKNSPFSKLNDDIFYLIYNSILPYDPKQNYKMINYMLGFTFFKSYPVKSNAQQSINEFPSPPNKRRKIVGEKDLDDENQPRSTFSYCRQQ